MVKAVMLQQSVIVAGHPRSGTSLACQLLESGGVDFPSDFQGDEYNQEGYYELDKSKKLSKQLISEAMTEQNTKTMNDLVRRLNDLSGYSGLKIVRVPALFFYQHIAKDLKVVFLYRHPANVKSSLLRRGISEFSLSWVENNNALIAGYENIDESIILSYESLIERADHVPVGFQKLGFNVDLDRVSSDRETQTNSRIYLTEDERNLHRRLGELEEESCSLKGSS